MPRPVRSGTRSSQRLASTSDHQEPRSSSRLSSRSLNDLPEGPGIIELATGIAETIANRLAAQISSSLETLRLEVSSSIARNRQFGPDEPNLPQRSGSLGKNNVPDQGNPQGKLRVPSFEEIAKGTRDGPADVSELTSFRGAGPVQADLALPTRENVCDDERLGKQSPPADRHYERSNCVGHCSSVCPHWNNLDLRSRLPKLEIPRFAGDPMEWPMFSSAFHQSVHSVLNSDADRLCILRELLAPQVRKAMAKYLYDPRQYTQALDVLQRRYGDPQRLVRACLKSVAALRPWHDFDYEGLRAFSDELQGIVSVLSLGGHEVEICSSSNVNTVVKKMPRQLRDEWGQFVTRSIRPRFPNLHDLSDWISERREAADAITDESDDLSCGAQRPLHDKKRRPRVVAAAILSDTNALACPLCGGAHLLPSCPTFIRLRMERRAEVVRTKGCCYRCLQPGHTAKRCSTRSRCSETGCRAAHHPMLHGAPRLFDKKEPLETTHRQPNEPFTGAACDEKTFHCLLPIVPLILVAPDGRCYRTRALLDSGSEISMIHMDVANALGLKGARESCRFTTFHDQQRALNVRRVSFRIKSTDGLYTEDIEDAYAVPKLQLPNQIKGTGTALRHYTFLHSVAVDTSGPTDVTLLIGMDYPAAHAVLDSISDRCNPRSPRAILTPFGWTVVGPLPYEQGLPEQPHCYRLATNDAWESPATEQLLDRFFSCELMCPPTNPDKPISLDEKRAWRILKETTRFNGRRYQAGLLWARDQPGLPVNRVTAVRRFASLERRLNTDAKLCAKYVAAMQEYIRAGHARKLSPEEVNAGPLGRTWWLPHHPVINPNKASKLRIVFDAAATFKGVSLNSALLKGPDLTANMTSVLLRFRLHPVAVSSDIIKMFHQVMVQPSDRSALRFVWKEPGSSQPLCDYQMMVQIFGATCSPTICAYTLRKAAMDSGVYADLVMRQVINHFYVDNWLASFRSEEEAAQTVGVVTRALERAGFKLAQWASSHPDVLRPVGEEPLSSVNMDLDSVPVERTLGLTWDTQKDAFLLCFKVRPGSRTKREVLRTVATIFDPLGFLEPVTLRAKLIMQAMWRLKLDWDDPLPVDIQEEWNAWLTHCLESSPVIVSRCLIPNAPAFSTELHVFADASEAAYGAVAYLRTEMGNDIVVSFVTAKSRVGPIKSTTIPRMELNAAVMATRLMNMIKDCLGLNFHTVMLHVDSTTVLRWIRSTSCRFHTYVRNRIAEILESSVPEQWHYVRSAENPADDCSRGLFASELHPDHRFLRGPEFLWRDRSTWPTEPGLANEDVSPTDDGEIEYGTWVGAARVMTNRIDELVAKVSRLERLVRITAYIIRFISNARNPKDGHRFTGPLSVNELSDAFFLHVRIAQTRAFESEKSALLEKRELNKRSSLVALTPFIDAKGLLRVGGRLKGANIPLDARHPIIIPPKDRLAELIALDVHTKIAHSSTERTLHELRKRFWLPHGRRVIRAVIHRCGFCKRTSARPGTPFMANLPTARTTPGLPVFTNCGVDYFGPFEVLLFRRRVKRWACIFTCLASRAIHLEMAYSLDTESFLAAMFRFEHRRGTPAAYWSDNGKNFVGANRELLKCLQRLDQVKITESLSIRRAAWNFIPPNAPHMSGAWEALIKTVKRALNVVLQGRTLTDEILVTALVHVECIVNGRPLTHLSSGADDPQPLTPNHLLMGRSIPDVAPDVISTESISLKKRWRYSQYLANQFWKRWIKEYLPTLMGRRKWFSHERNLRNDDVVIVIEPNMPRGKWSLGRVIHVFPGEDGIVRSALVRANGTTVHRPATKLCLLESADNDVDSPSVHRAGDVAD